MHKRSGWYRHDRMPGNFIPAGRLHRSFVLLNTQHYAARGTGSETHRCDYVRLEGHGLGIGGHRDRGLVR